MKNKDTFKVAAEIPSGIKRDPREKRNEMGRRESARERAESTIPREEKTKKRPRA